VQAKLRICAARNGKLPMRQGGRIAVEVQLHVPVGHARHLIENNANLIDLRLDQHLGSL
jgi:hypothetical protein